MGTTGPRALGMAERVWIHTVERRTPVTPPWHNGRNDCAKGRFELRHLSDQHDAQRRLKVDAVTAAVNMMTLGSARMCR